MKRLIHTLAIILLVSPALSTFAYSESHTQQEATHETTLMQLVQDFKKKINELETKYAHDIKTVVNLEMTKTLTPIDVITGFVTDLDDDIRLLQHFNAAYKHFYEYTSIIEEKKAIHETVKLGEDLIFNLTTMRNGLRIPKNGNKDDNWFSVLENRGIPVINNLNSNKIIC